MPSAASDDLEPASVSPESSPGVSTNPELGAILSNSPSSDLNSVVCKYCVFGERTVASQNHRLLTGHKAALSVVSNSGSVVVEAVGVKVARNRAASKDYAEFDMKSNTIGKKAVEVLTLGHDLIIVSCTTVLSHGDGWGQLNNF